MAIAAAREDAFFNEKHELTSPQEKNASNSAMVKGSMTSGPSKDVSGMPVQCNHNINNSFDADDDKDPLPSDDDDEVEDVNNTNQISCIEDDENDNNQLCQVREDFFHFSSSFSQFLKLLVHTRWLHG